jgi:hypothetical protein
MGFTASKICAAVFYRPVLIIPRWSFAGPKRAGQGGGMTDREELRRLIDVIEKASGSGSVEQAVHDIKTFANTVSFLANKLDARLKGGEVTAKNKPKSRVGKAIAAPPVPKPNTPNQQAAPNATGGGMPSAVSSSTSQADYDRLKPLGSQGAISTS